MLVVHIPSWFPRADSPLEGNFILKQIATTTPYTTAVILHHADDSLKIEELHLPDNIIFFPVRNSGKMSKAKLIRAYFKAFQSIIEQYGKPDLLHLHITLPLGIIASRLSRKYNIPLILSEHWSIYQPQNRSQLSILQQWQLKYIFKTARHITTVSDNLHNAIVETIPAARKIPYTQISNAINTDLFCPAENAAHAKKQLLHISTLDDRAKNIMGILRAVKRLSEQRSDFELNIIHDLENPAVHHYIQQEHLEDIIHLLGKKSEEEVARAIQQCDFMVQFSNYENQPCVLLEAFCCGKPVVTTPVGGIPEIVNEHNALIVAPRDEEDLSIKLNEMLDRFTRYSASNIRQDAVGKYSAEIVGKAFLQTYRDVMGRR